MVLAGVSRAANADLLGPLAANVAIEPGGCLFALGGAGCPSRRRGKGSFSLVGIGHCLRLLSDSRQEMMQIHSFASDCSSIGLPVTCEYNTSGSKSAPFSQQMVPDSNRLGPAEILLLSQIFQHHLLQWVESFSTANGRAQSSSFRSTPHGGAPTIASPVPELWARAAPQAPQACGSQ